MFQKSLFIQFEFENEFNIWVFNSKNLMKFQILKEITNFKLKKKIESNSTVAHCEWESACANRKISRTSSRHSASTPTAAAATTTSTATTTTTAAATTTTTAQSNKSNSPAAGLKCSVAYRDRSVAYATYHGSWQQ